MLVVSQFTFAAIAGEGGGRRSTAAGGGVRSVNWCGSDFTVETGEFQAHMHVEIVNDGPVTILLDSQRRW